jgi:hypothetical protein
VTNAFDRALCSVGVEATPTLASNSLIVLDTRVQTEHWASVMPAKLAETLGLTNTVRSIPDRRSGSRRLRSAWRFCSASR